jgi:hypothetical protein
MSQTVEEHRLSPGSWPWELLFGVDGLVDEGLVVRSLSGNIEGRSAGSRAVLLFDRLSWVFHWCELGNWPAISSLFAGLAIRSGDQDRASRLAGGGGFSAWFVSPGPLGTPPLNGLARESK